MSPEIAEDQEQTLSKAESTVTFDHLSLLARENDGRPLFCSQLELRQQAIL
jgi:hypothetical protein